MISDPPVDPLRPASPEAPRLLAWLEAELGPVLVASSEQAGSRRDLRPLVVEVLMSHSPSVATLPELLGEDDQVLNPAEVMYLHRHSSMK